MICPIAADWSDRQGADSLTATRQPSARLSACSSDVTRNW